MFLLKHICVMFCLVAAQAWPFSTLTSTPTLTQCLKIPKDLVFQEGLRKVGDLQVQSDSVITTNNSLLKTIGLVLTYSAEEFPSNPIYNVKSIPIGVNWKDFPLPAGNYSWFVALLKNVTLGSEKICFTVQPNKTLPCKSNGSAHFPKGLIQRIPDTAPFGGGTFLNCQLTVPEKSVLVGIQIKTTAKATFHANLPVVVYANREEPEKKIFFEAAMDVTEGDSHEIAFDPGNKTTFWITAFLQYADGPVDIYYKFLVAKWNRLD